MPQDSLSSTTQSIGNPGFLLMTCLDTTGAGNDVTVQFNPTYAKMVNPQRTPLQHVNLSVNGTAHIFVFSSNEPLALPCVFQDLPSFSARTDRRELSDGYLDLLSFVRWTLNYHVSTCVVTTPDGFIETMRYMGGIESFVEAEGQNRAQRAQRWAGQLTMIRVLS